MSVLADHVEVARRFQRSLRIDSDLGEVDALHGFVCHSSASQALLSMLEQFTQSSQRAFTWTGPYGSGKSSLALALAGLLGPAGPLRSAAHAALGSGCANQLLEALSPSEAGWLTIPIVGRRADPAAVIGTALHFAIKGKAGASARVPQQSQAVITLLLEAATARPNDGVLVLIDELGKFLDAAARDDADVHFFQDLAERASRSSGRILIIGILHQPFEQYARRLGRETRDEWAKIQGRFADIPMVVAIDEVVDLVGRAIRAGAHRPESARIAEVVACAVQRRRPGIAPDLAERLHKCWPLHPVTAALLGPMSRRRFGQNERSVFGFLTSAEPAGFQEFLRTTLFNDAALFGPDRLWDYLRVNLEPAILASSDSHRWAQGVDAVERCEARGGPLHVRLAKALALIDLFRSTAQIAADLPTLMTCAPEEPAAAVEAAIADLERWSVAVFRRHLNAWAVYSGSDFDIESALATASAQQVGLDLQRLAQLAGLQPILAKKHYYETGNMRWFQCCLIEAADLAKLPAANPDAAGQFAVLIPSEEESRPASLARCLAASATAAGGAIVAIGYPATAWRIRELGRELLALQCLSASRPELAGDGVARREISARFLAVSSEFELRVRQAFQDASWFVAGAELDGPNCYTLSRLASELADHCYGEAPHIHSELVNRQRPSSNSQAGVRELLHAMIAHQRKPDLGIQGFPIERGLYSTVLARAGLHRVEEGGEACFRAPDDGCSWLPESA